MVMWSCDFDEIMIETFIVVTQTQKWIYYDDEIIYVNIIIINLKKIIKINSSDERQQQ